MLQRIVAYCSMWKPKLMNDTKKCFFSIDVFSAANFFNVKLLLQMVDFCKENFSTQNQYRLF
jgi:hypothetical protein